MEEYIRELCDEKHKVIEEKLHESEKQMDKMDKKINWLLGIAVTTLAGFALSCLTMLIQGSHLIK